MANRGEIYYFENERAIGSEQRNSRPCVIISNDKNNTFSPCVTVIPITNRPKKELPVHCKISTIYNKVKGTALCEQIQCVSKYRLIPCNDKVTYSTLKNIEKCIKIQCDIL